MPDVIETSSRRDSLLTITDYIASDKQKGGIMKQIKRILVPTDLSEHSRNGLRYACSLAADNKGILTILHVAAEIEAWQLYFDEFTFPAAGGIAWPRDRVLAEAALDLTRFVEPHLDALRPIPSVTKRVVSGSIADRIAAVAEQERADLIVMSPRRHTKWMGLFAGSSITERVTRMSPCPVLAVAPPLPSSPWRGKLRPALFHWRRPTAASI
jgi:nucleotide-binding universal stress UspA family protein